VKNEKMILENLISPNGNQIEWIESPTKEHKIFQGSNDEKGKLKKRRLDGKKSLTEPLEQTLSAGNNRRSKLREKEHSKKRLIRSYSYSPSYGERKNLWEEEKKKNPFVSKAAIKSVPARKRKLPLEKIGGKGKARKKSSCNIKT